MRISSGDSLTKDSPSHRSRRAGLKTHINPIGIAKAQEIAATQAAANVTQLALKQAELEAKLLDDEETEALLLLLIAA